MFTVVIPLYNKGRTVLETVNSVLSQTNPNFEIIIVNDGSSDNGVKIIEENIDDSRVQIINQKNQGVSVARNTGVENAQHDYIAFLDGDDLWMPRYLEEMHKTIEQFPNAGMYCCAGLIRNPDKDHLRLADKYKGLTLEIDFFENPEVFVHTSATIVTKQSFTLAGGFPVGMKRNQDFALFFSIALLSNVIYHGVPLSIYCGGVEGQTTTTPAKDVLTHIINRYNHVQQTFNTTDKRNKTYLTFTRYQLRHMLLLFLRSNDFQSIRNVISDLDDSLLQELLPWERYGYKHKLLKQLSMSFIYFSKILWRQNGYPRVNW